LPPEYYVERYDLPHPAKVRRLPARRYQYPPQPISFFEALGLRGLNGIAIAGILGLCIGIWGYCQKYKDNRGHVTIREGRVHTIRTNAGDPTPAEEINKHFVLSL